MWWHKRGDAAAEIESHLAMLEEQYRRSGMSDADARAAARRQFGNATIVREDVRSVHVNRFLESIVQDVRYAMRAFGRNPGFVFAAIATAALGIGSTTAVFSVVDRILFRPLPYPDEDRLVSVGMMAPLDTNEFMFASEYFDLRKDPGPFAGVTAFQAGAIDCDLTEQNPLRLRCVRAESNFLPVLGLPVVAGRTFTAEEDGPNGPPAALISYGLWQSRFAHDPNVIGRTLPLDGAAVPIVGVMPKNFEIPTLTHADILLPLALRPTERNGRAFRVFGRLKPGSNPVQAWQQLQPHFQRALEEVPRQFRKEVSFKVRPVRERQVGDVRLASLALMGSVLAVLLIACANIATLLLAKGVAREREMTMRAALGASRARLIRQTLTESVLLALGGGIGGTVLAYALVRGFIATAPGGLPRIEQASIDWRVLVFTFAVSLAAGITFGLAPALRMPSASLIGGWRTTGASVGLVRSVLVTLQIALCIVLLTGAGLLMRSLWNLENVPLGMETDHVLTARFVLGKQRFTRNVDQLAFFSELEQKLAALPGVQSTAITDSVPPTGGTRSRPLSTIEVEGKPRRPEGTGGMVPWRYVTPGYFATLRIPILAGRGFIEQDRAPKAYSIILSQSLARALLPGDNPIGRHVLRTPEEEWFTVVGVAGDVKSAGLRQTSGPEYYVVRKATPDATYANQEPPIGWRAAAALIRTGIDPKLVAASARAAIAELDPTLPLELETMHQRLDGVLARPRFNASLLALFASIGVLLAAVGLYGVVAFLVGQKTQEIGVRMALGATPAAIAKLVLEAVARWTVAGVVLGAAGAWVAAKALRGLLFGVPEQDQWTILLVVPVLMLVAVAAAGVPVRRASRLDPIAALRHD